MVNLIPHDIDLMRIEIAFCVLLTSHVGKQVENSIIEIPSPLDLLLIQFGLLRGLRAKNG